MRRPEGDFDFGPYRIRWQSEASTAVIDGSGYTLGLRDFQLALYDTQVKAFQKDGSPWFDLKLKLVGFKRVRGLFNPFLK